MMVPFATICDVDGCTARSPEYSAFPSCRNCMEEICPAHMVPGSASDDENNLCTCQRCGLAGHVDMNLEGIRWALAQLGSTHVYTAGGWTLIESWRPYGYRWYHGIVEAVEGSPLAGAFVHDVATHEHFGPLGTWRAINLQQEATQ